VKRAQWLKRKLHACETIHTQKGSFVVVLHDDKGRSAVGEEFTEEGAFADALTAYRAARVRASLTTRQYGRIPEEA